VKAFSPLFIFLLSAGAAALLHAQDPQQENGPEKQIRYGRDIRPILSDKCFRCHGPDPSSRKEELRLDQRAFAIADRDGLFAIVPGKPEESELWRRVSSLDPDEVMPPAESHKKTLDEVELNTIRTWIEQGAPYEEHWSFSQPQKNPLPQNKNQTWPANEIDHFILAELEGVGLSPSLKAKPETLVRRIFFDLTGLPPTVEEYEQFLADDSPRAFENLVDKLLTQEPYVSRYAERMATPWLDAARYADTNGIHMDAGRQMWKWRDWMLEAFRDGKPYDQFLTEQIAGDLLPDATLAQQVASGFHRNHVITDEGGAIDAEYLVEYSVDRVSTTGEVFLGLTLGCARCHDHKFDPVTQEDFYSLFAYFNSIEEKGLYSQNQDTKRAFIPFIKVPSMEQSSQLDTYSAELSQAKEELSIPNAEDAKAFEAFLSTAPESLGVHWAKFKTTDAKSTMKSTLMILEDQSVLASGENPAKDDHIITLQTDETDLRLLLFEAIPDPSFPNGRVGRADNGNAVLSQFSAEVISIADPEKKKSLNFTWAWADHEQPDADFQVVNILDADIARGWAIQGHQISGGRTALLLADEAFGYPGGTEIRITLSYQSIYSQHTLGRVRITPGVISDTGLNALPVADSTWYATWPYKPKEKYSGYEEIFGPEADATIDFTKKYPPDDYSWVYRIELKDDQVNSVLPVGEVVSFAGKRLFVPSARNLEISLGSDDGVQVFLDGEIVFENRVDRGAAADQDKLMLTLSPGVHTLVLKVVNTGGVGGYYWKSLPPIEEFSGNLVWSLTPKETRDRGANNLSTRLSEDWRKMHSPVYREKVALAENLGKEIKALEASIPLSMVMRERKERRPTYVLMRGEYDAPDEDRPVERNVPSALGSLPEGAPDNRLGLANWMTADDNPLVARVFVNRIWEMVFGNGIVATSRDFGLQGAWPSHPELLDWLAVDFRENGWDIKHLVKQIVTSQTYQQSSAIRPEASAKDAGNRLLSSYPRRRLGAEEIRDQALYLSGLLVEQFGGPSVKPYQPEGLWKEVAMPQSNTRNFMRGNGDELWRRSLYTYWKRASPPPSLLTMDAPTREFCTISRGITNTPLQALVLWNDVQFVEAARVLAQQTLATKNYSLAGLFLQCTGRRPNETEAVRLQEFLTAFTKRFTELPEDAEKLLQVGESMLPEGADYPVLAAWTMLANALLSLDEVISRT